MSIQEILEKFKSDIYIGALLVLVAIVSFGLGRESVAPMTRSQENIAASAGIHTIDRMNSGADTPETSPTSSAVEGGYVASKTGTKYHLPWCAGAQQMKEENKIWFKTKEEAEDAGYTPAVNCKGI